MTLAPGTKLRQYEVVASIGVGGMGEVYRARDTKLGREVAIKVLPEALSKDRERLLRFEREAKLLASLNHPAIATLYGFEDDFLVMELVEGETLAARIARGPIPIDEVRRDSFRRRSFLDRRFLQEKIRRSETCHKRLCQNKTTNGALDPRLAQPA